MTHPRSSIWIPTLFIAILTIFAAPLMASSAKPGRPEMNLSVSTHHGFYPLDLVLEGSISAGKADLSEFESCLVTVEWTYRTPGGQDLISRKEIPCVEAISATSVPEAFKQKLTLEEPGIYSYRIVLVSKTGRRYASASQEVKVIKSPLELGASSTRSDNR